MAEQKLISTLKICIVLGISLILVGHYLLVSDLLVEKNSIHGIMIGATLIAVGILFSLPTKIYLTIMLMKMEAKHNKRAQSPL